MKLKAPTGCHAASHGGRFIAIAQDGTIEVDHEAAPVFIAHGFCRVDTDEGLQPESAKSVHSRPPSKAKSGGTEPIPRGVEALSRNELFALLRAKGVPVRLPISNNDLRAAARRVWGS